MSLSHKDLEVYKRAYKLSIEIHKLTLELPKFLNYELGDQIRRASRSIPSNIAEAYGRNKSVKDTLNQLNDALGSNDEVLFNLNFMKDVDLLDSTRHDYFIKEYTICGKQLYALIKSLKDKLPAARN